MFLFQEIYLKSFEWLLIFFLSSYYSIFEGSESNVFGLIYENLMLKMLHYQIKIKSYFKLKTILNDLIKKNILGHVLAFVLIVEFQKRGLSYTHILLILIDV